MSRPFKSALEPLSTYDPYRPRALRLKDVPTAAAQPPGYDWQKEYDRLGTRIEVLSAKATMLRQKGKDDEAIAFVAKARKLYEDQATLVRNGRG